MWGPTEFYATGNLLDFDLSNRLGELDVPVLLIAGEFDEARPDRMREFQKKIPNAELIVIGGAAHATIDVNPDRYMEAVGNFLSSAEVEINPD
jgi:proline iminopeptidase